MEIIKVVSAKDESEKLTQAYVGNGSLINSDFLDGLQVSDAKEKIIKEIEKNKIGKRKILFRLKRLGYFQTAILGMSYSYDLS